MLLTIFFYNEICFFTPKEGDDKEVPSKHTSENLKEIEIAENSITNSFGFTDFAPQIIISFIKISSQYCLHPFRYI